MDSNIKTKISRRRSYTVCDKLKILETYDQNDGNISETARVTGVSRAVISRWLQNRALLESDMAELDRRKMTGGGKKPICYRLESRLVDFVKKMRASKMYVTYRMMQRKATEFAKSLNLKNFRASIGFIQRFCRRNNFVYRKPTHKAQQNKKSAKAQSLDCLIYMNRLNSIAQTTPGFIFNMDETPFYYDIVYDRTIDNVGSRTIDVVHTGHTKSRFTVVVTLCSDGSMLKGFVIFGGLKNIPKLTLPSNIVVVVNKSGSMDQK